MPGRLDQVKLVPRDYLSPRNGYLQACLQPVLQPVRDTSRSAKRIQILVALWHKMLKDFSNVILIPYKCLKADLLASLGVSSTNLNTSAREPFTTNRSPEFEHFA